MANHPIISDKQEEFINFLIRKINQTDKNIPSISEISKELGISTACLREQIELARNLGLIRTQPRTGMEILPYSFTPAVIKSLYFALKLDREYFKQYSEIRNHLERSFFKEAAALLKEEDIRRLNELIQTAFKKLNGNPVQIPHSEHRKYHLLIYKRLNNTFLNGLLEAYWDTYELVGLDVYADLKYLESVWEHHKRIVDYLNYKEIDKAYDLLISHMQLIYQR